jgi:hypothetical protein
MQTKTYQLRAECSEDVINFLDVTQSQLTQFTMYRPNPDLPDVILIFQTTLELDKIRFTIKDIGNAHVMNETVDYIDQYTGIRM